MTWRSEYSNCIHFLKVLWNSFIITIFFGLSALAVEAYGFTLVRVSVRPCVPVLRPRPFDIFFWFFCMKLGLHTTSITSKKNWIKIFFDPPGGFCTPKNPFLAKKLDTKSQKSHDHSSKNAHFLGEFLLRRLLKKSWHHRLKIIVAYRENQKAANHKQCITKTNMLESKSTSSLELW